MSRASIVLLVLFSFAFFIALIAATNPRYIAQMEITAIWLRQAMGSLLAIATALAIVVRALNHQPLGDVIVLIVALLAALAVVSTSWAVTIPLAGIVILLVIKGLITSLAAKNE